MLKHATKGLYKKLSTLVVASTITTSAALVPAVAYAEKYADDNYVYAGLELGVSKPVWKQFDYADREDKSRKTRISLQDSKMIGGRLGWSFYPNMAVEISGTHQPEYGVRYLLPATPVAPGITLPATPDKTKMKSDIYTINLIYKLPELEFATIKPYVIIGGGIGRINVKPKSTEVAVPASLNMMLGDKLEYFRVKKSKSTVPVYQAGIGFAKEIGNNFEIDISSKFQVVQDIKINYEKLDSTTMQFKKAKPIKKTIAVGEIAVGLLFKLPV